MVRSELRRLRIAQVAPPLERVPPSGYGGTERIVHELTTTLVAGGHDVTTFASGDSDLPGRLVPTVRRALRPAGLADDPSPWFLSTIQAVASQARRFDVVHSHLEWYSPLLAALLPVPVVSTFHGRLDLPWAAGLLGRALGHLVAISRSQAGAHPDVRWAGIVHNGLSLAAMPFEPYPTDTLCFVGRIAPEKGIVEAIEIARRSGRTLRLAAKDPGTAAERAYRDAVLAPALRAAGSAVEFVGELSPHDRNRLFAESRATLMPGAWPEPFGLVAIESLACGTPIVARRSGALPEIVRDGIDGFFGADVDGLVALVERAAALDRAAIRRSVVVRFSAERMVEAYETLYERALVPEHPAVAARVRARSLAPVGPGAAPAVRPSGSRPLDAVEAEAGAPRATG